MGSLHNAKRGNYRRPSRRSERDCYRVQAADGRRRVPQTGRYINRPARWASPSRHFQASARWRIAQQSGQCRPIAKPLPTTRDLWPKPFLLDDTDKSKLLFGDSSQDLVSPKSTWRPDQILERRWFRPQPVIADQCLLWRSPTCLSGQGTLIWYCFLLMGPYQCGKHGKVYCNERCL